MSLCQFKTIPLLQRLPESWHQLRGVELRIVYEEALNAPEEFVEHLNSTSTKASVTEDCWMEVFTKLRAWIISTSPPFTQSSSHLTPPDSESQEKPSTDDLQIHGTILCHVIRLWFDYFNLTWGEKEVWCKSWLCCVIKLLKPRNLGSLRFPLSHYHPVV